MEALGGLNLQSGFVLAAIVFAVFFASRMADADELPKRLFQVTLGIAVALTVVAGTTAFLRAPDLPEALEQDAFSDDFPTDDEDALEYFNDVSERAQTATTVHAGAALLLAVGGLMAMRWARITGLAVALAGLLLLLFGGARTGGGGTGTDPFTAIFSLLGALFGGGGSSSQVRDIAYFLVLLGGSLALAVHGLVRWDDFEVRRPAAPLTPPPMTEA